MDTNILFYLLLFYILTFLFFICLVIYHRMNINKLATQAVQMANTLIELQIIKGGGDIKKANHEKHYFNNWIRSKGFQFTTIKLDSEYFSWRKKAGNYMSLLYLSDDLPDRVDTFISFHTKAASYKDDYNLSYIISKTAKTPSLLLSYIGIPENWFTRLISVISGVLAIFKFFQTFLLPILRYVGLS